MISSEEWKIVYYESTNGDIPVHNFIESLNARAKSKISNTFDLLSEYGIRLGLPHVKKLVGTDIWELRILGGDNIRIFYIAISGKVFLLLHGFIKKSQKTPNKEMKVALMRLNEYKSRKH
jgi:phage-related protein